MYEISTLLLVTYFICKTNIIDIQNWVWIRTSDPVKYRGCDTDNYPIRLAWDSFSTCAMLRHRQLM